MDDGIFKRWSKEGEFFSGVTDDITQCNHMGKAWFDCPHCLRHRITELERHNALLREVANAADDMAWCYVESHEEPEQMKLREALQNAIDGGALEGDE